MIKMQCKLNNTFRIESERREHKLEEFVLEKKKQARLRNIITMNAVKSKDR